MSNDKSSGSIRERPLWPEQQGTAHMRFNAFARTHIVRTADKEAKLRAFIHRDMMARKAAGGSAQGGRYRVIALSMQSPVAMALASLTAEAAALGIEIQAVLADVDPSAPAPDCSVSFAMGALTRCLADPRLLEAHELLVLGERRVWVGDCMRREPASRDAFECYSQDCAVTAAWTARAFERIWAAARPVTSGMRLMRAARRTAREEAALLPDLRRQFRPAVPITRH